MYINNYAYIHVSSQYASSIYIYYILYRYIATNQVARLRTKIVESSYYV